MISKEKADFIRSLADPNGHISPSNVIAAARDPASPIHGDFEWNVGAAAEQYWLDQARTLIRFVKVEVQIERRTVVAPYYVPDPERPANSSRYIELTVAGLNAEMARSIVIAELDRLALGIRRAQKIAAVLGLSEMLDALFDNVRTIRTAAERKRDAKTTARSKRGPGKHGDESRV
jgi:hypothetical protein